MSVHLVGAGPGDPGLITVRGLELVRTCDVLVYDRLVAPEVVAEAPPHALLIPRDDLSQARINALLVAHGSTGATVVRLKGGDPLVFGRGGEEALALRRAGIPAEIVPGVSATAAVPAAAGIPLTHRGVSDRVTLASCHTADDGEAEYERLAAAGGTLVLFMGGRRVGRVVHGLLSAGLAPTTPAAAISRGTRHDQEVVRSTLEGLPAASAGLPTPTLLVIGDVAALELGTMSPDEMTDELLALR
jgi:uroporphyrin-III C-methyltransferase